MQARTLTNHTFFCTCKYASTSSLMQSQATCDLFYSFEIRETSTLDIHPEFFYHADRLTYTLIKGLVIQFNSPDLAT